MSKPWSYCPECGSEETQYEEGDHKQCANCHQEWFSDIDYSDVVRKHLSGQHSDKDAVIERLRAELAALKAGQGEVVGDIRAMADGKQYASLLTEHMNSQHLVGAKLYTAPPASADTVSVAPGLERAIQIVREVAKTQPGYSDEREAIFEALSEAYVEAMAPQPPPASVNAVSVPVELLDRVAERFAKAQIFDYSTELRALIAQQGKAVGDE